jgi:hypothetical protein
MFQYFPRFTLLANHKPERLFPFGAAKVITISSIPKNSKPFLKYFLSHVSHLFISYPIVQYKLKIPYPIPH